MAWTDENVPLTCGECDAYCEGYTDTVCHILQCHGEAYNQDEASAMAKTWVEQAHTDHQEALERVPRSEKF